MKTILVIGSGTMGGGIAHSAAQNGYKTYLYNPREASWRQGIGKIEKRLAGQVERGKLTAEDKEAILERISGCSDLKEAEGAEIVVEAVPEKMELKKEEFQYLDSLFPPSVLLGTTTSSLSITEIASATMHPERVIGLHFFNPVPVMSLLEIIRGARTSEESYQRSLELAKDLGKTPVSVNDGPGFVVSRILVPMINEAALICGEGLASAADIDTAMMLGANHPMGPLALGDLIGLDTCLKVLDILYTDTKDSRYRPAPVLLKLVRAGLYGRKSGEGFFKY